jgi:hypothetical protein
MCIIPRKYKDTILAILFTKSFFSYYGLLITDFFVDVILTISHFPSIQVLSHYIQVLRLRFDSGARQLHALFLLILQHSHALDFALYGLQG